MDKTGTTDPAIYKSLEDTAEYAMLDEAGLGALVSHGLIIPDRTVGGIHYFSLQSAEFLKENREAYRLLLENGNRTEASEYASGHVYGMEDGDAAGIGAFQEEDVADDDPENGAYMEPLVETWEEWADDGGDIPPEKNGKHRRRRGNGKHGKKTGEKDSLGYANAVVGHHVMKMAMPQVDYQYDSSKSRAENEMSLYRERIKENERAYHGRASAEEKRHDEAVRRLKDESYLRMKQEAANARYGAMLDSAWEECQISRMEAKELYDQGRISYGEYYQRMGDIQEKEAAGKSSLERERRLALSKAGTDYIKELGNEEKEHRALLAKYENERAVGVFAAVSGIERDALPPGMAQAHLKAYGSVRDYGQKHVDIWLGARAFGDSVIYGAVQKTGDGLTDYGKYEETIKAQYRDHPGILGRQFREMEEDYSRSRGMSALSDGQQRAGKDSRAPQIKYGARNRRDGGGQEDLRTFYSSGRWETSGTQDSRNGARPLRLGRGPGIKSSIFTEPWHEKTGAGGRLVPAGSRSDDPGKKSRAGAGRANGSGNRDTVSPGRHIRTGNAQKNVVPSVYGRSRGAGDAFGGTGQGLKAGGSRRAGSTVPGHVLKAGRMAGEGAVRLARQTVGPDSQPGSMRNAYLVARLAAGAPVLSAYALNQELVSFERGHGKTVSEWAASLNARYGRKVFDPESFFPENGHMYGTDWKKQHNPKIRELESALSAGDFTNIYRWIVAHGTDVRDFMASDIINSPDWYKMADKEQKFLLELYNAQESGWASTRRGIGQAHQNVARLFRADQEIRALFGGRELGQITEADIRAVLRSLPAGNPLKPRLGMALKARQMYREMQESANAWSRKAFLFGRLSQQPMGRDAQEAVRSAAQSYGLVTLAGDAAYYTAKGAAGIVKYAGKRALDPVTVNRLASSAAGQALGKVGKALVRVGSPGKLAGKAVGGVKNAAGAAGRRAAGLGYRAGRKGAHAGYRLGREAVAGVGRRFGHTAAAKGFQKAGSAAALAVRQAWGVLAPVRHAAAGAAGRVKGAFTAAKASASRFAAAAASVAKGALVFLGIALAALIIICYAVDAGTMLFATITGFYDSGQAMESTAGKAMQAMAEEERLWYEEIAGIGGQAIGPAGSYSGVYGQSLDNVKLGDSHVYIHYVDGDGNPTAAVTNVKEILCMYTAYAQQNFDYPPMARYFGTEVWKMAHSVDPAEDWDVSDYWETSNKYKAQVRMEADASGPALSICGSISGTVRNEADEDMEVACDNIVYCDNSKNPEGMFTTAAGGSLEKLQESAWKGEGDPDKRCKKVRWTAGAEELECDGAEYGDVVDGTVVYSGDEVVSPEGDGDYLIQDGVKRYTLVSIREEAHYSYTYTYDIYDQDPVTGLWTPAGEGTFDGRRTVGLKFRNERVNETQEGSTYTYSYKVETASVDFSGCKGHCGGHLQVDVAAKIAGFDGAGGLFRIFGDYFDGDAFFTYGAAVSQPPLTADALKYLFFGSGRDFGGFLRADGTESEYAEWARVLAGQDWYGLYGITNSQGYMPHQPLGDGVIGKVATGQDIPIEEGTPRYAAVQTALQSVGVIPYYWGGKAGHAGWESQGFGAAVSPDREGRTRKGLDCSGFVSWVIATADNSPVPAVSAAGWAGQGSAAGAIRPGDVYSKRTGEPGRGGAHCGIIVGVNSDGTVNIVHSPGKPWNVVIYQEGINPATLGAVRSVLP